MIILENKMSEDKKKEIGLLDYAKCIGGFVEVYKDQHGVYMVEVKYNGIHRYFRITDPSFQRICLQIIVDTFNQLIGPMQIKSVIEYLVPVHSSISVKEFFHRTISLEDAVIYDNANELGEYTVITADSVEVRGDMLCPFYPAGSSGTQVLPDLSASVNDINGLRKFIALKPHQKREWLLIASYITYGITGQGSFPMLAYQGARGRAKSGAARCTMSMVDPKSVGTMHMNSSVDDVLTAARNHKLLIFDNLRSISENKSDLLCQLSTGGGQMKRKLYTDDTLVQFDVCIPTILTSIDQVIKYDDAISRTLQISMHEIDPSERKSEGELKKSFDDEKPKIFGGFCKLIQEVLRLKDTLNITRIPTRLADFYRVALAVEKILDYPDGSLDRALMESTQRLLKPSGNDHSIVFGILDLVKASDGIWEGAFGDLMTELILRDDDCVIPSQTSLSKKVRKKREVLKSIGVEMSLAEECPGETFKGGKRAVRFTLNDNLR